MYFLCISKNRLLHAEITSNTTQVIWLPWLQELIQSLHLHIDSLKNQVGSLLDEAEAKERLVGAINQQLDIRDKRIRDLTKQLQETGGQLAEASTALEAKNVLLKEKEKVRSLQLSELALPAFANLACFVCFSPYGSFPKAQGGFASQSAWHSIAGRRNAVKSVS
jgi:peptidoglycan hydrolase CwlO-like protein